MTDPRETASANEPGVPPTRGGSGGPARQTSGVGVAVGRDLHVILGIDPGLSGAVAVWRDGAIEIHDMPVLEILRGGKRKRDLDAAVLADCIEAAKAQHAFVEQVSSMPGQGVSAMFAFGKSFGTVIAILATLDIPFTLVAPARWKKAMQVPASKDGARARASQLMPKVAHYWPRVRDDGRAESAMIAWFGARSLGLVP